MKNGVVMLPDCTGEYNNASALPGERNITLFTATMSREARWKTTCVTGGWDMDQSDCNVRPNYWSTATCRGCAALLIAPHGLLWSCADSERTHQWSSSALKTRIIKFGTWTSAYDLAVRQNIATVLCYIVYNLLNIVTFLGKHPLFSTETSSL